MRSREHLVMVVRVAADGGEEAEAIFVERYPDGFVEIKLDDGGVLQLDPFNADSLRAALNDAGDDQALPILGEAA